MHNLITITAATSNVIFIYHANAKLILRYLKLVGGNFLTSSGYNFGGSIYYY